MIKALGGELALVDQAPTSIKGRVSGADMVLVEQEALRLVQETGAFFINQFKNQDNPASQGIAALEMWEQSGRSIEVFADFVGTGGTFSGYALALRSVNPDVRCYVVEPFGCAYYKGEVIEGHSHGMQGGGYAKAMDLVDRNLLAGAIVVTDEEAREMARLMARKEGVFAGFTSGANVVAATKLLQSTERTRNIGIVINDCGLKYMSTDLY